LDLSSFASIESFANNFKSQHGKLDILMNNAGVMALPKKEQTQDGLEMQIGINHFGHFLLTNLLMDPLLAAGREGGDARIVTLSSQAHLVAFKGVNLAQPGLEDDGSYSAWGAYAQSKLANILFTRELQSRLGPASGVAAMAVHPGVVRTELGCECHRVYVRDGGGRRDSGRACRAPCLCPGFIIAIIATTYRKGIAIMAISADGNIVWEPQKSSHGSIDACVDAFSPCSCPSPHAPSMRFMMTKSAAPAPAGATSSSRRGRAMLWGATGARASWAPWLSPPSPVRPPSLPAAPALFRRRIIASATREGPGKDKRSGE
jgi:hypothetical protein